MEGGTRYITIKDAADMLDVTPATLRNWDRSGKLKALRDPQNGYRIYDVNSISAVLRKKGSAYEVPVRDPHFIQYSQPALFPTDQLIEDDGTDVRSLRLLVKRLSRAFRDSMGGGILERFEEISKVIWCKYFDETQVAASPSYGYQFYVARTDSNDEAYARIANLYQQATEQNPALFSNGLRRLSDDKVAIVKCVELLQDVRLLDIPSDVKGIIYEELVRNTFEKDEHQQFFTPRIIVEFLVALANPLYGSIICDPACGSGGFLIAILTSLQRQAVTAGCELLGFEIDRRMAWIAKLNLLMHGGSDGGVHYLGNGGSLSFSNEVNDIVEPDSIDLIITNPPFGSSYAAASDLTHFTLGKNKSSRRRGILFVERSIRWLKPGGRLAVILDDSVLNGKSNDDVRTFILQHTIVEAVISLPDVAFMPYATAKTSILLLRKKRSQEEEQTNIFMAEVNHIGKKANGDPLYSQTRDSNGKLMLLNDLPDVLEDWQLFKIGRLDPVSSSHSFACKPDLFRTSGKQGIRLDVPFHHPSRKSAEEILGRSIYPTPKLAELVVLRTNQTIPAQQDPDEMWNYIGLANIQAGTGEYYVSQVIGGKIKSNVRQFQQGDILFSRLRPELRKSVLITEEDEGYASSECLVLRTLASALQDTDLQSKVRKLSHSPISEVEAEYISFMLRSDLVFGQLVYQITGVGRPRVSKAAVLGVRIPLPPLSIQKEIVSAAKMARQHYEECRRRSELAVQEGEQALRSAYIFATEKLCPR